MKSFGEKERDCTAIFNQGGPYWHGSTPGKDTPILFKTEEDYRFVMNVLAQAAACFTDVLVIAFAVMNNHFHFVLQGDVQSVHDFYGFILKRISRSLTDVRDMPIRFDPIDSLRSMRNRIAYDHRNGYVADPSQTPFSYPWSSGRYYFNDYPVELQYSDITKTAARQMFRGREPELPSTWKVIDGYISPGSFCATTLGMSMFRDAHHYFSMLYKEVEAYRECAEELSDDEYMTDMELFNRVLSMANEQFKVSAFKDLNKYQKVELARKLRYDFRSTNGQIRRVLGLSQYEVDSLFPLRR